MPLSPSIIIIGPWKLKKRLTVCVRLCVRAFCVAYVCFFSFVFYFLYLLRIKRVHNRYQTVGGDSLRLGR